MISKPHLTALWAAALLLAILLAAANLFLGDLNQDEGWYLYAARMVAEGQLPYRDFAFTQAPLMPFVYSLAQPLVDRWGVGGGRLFTALLGLAAAAFAAALAARLVDRSRKGAAAALAFVLIGVNVYHSYFSTLVKTYSLSGLLLALGFLLLTLSDSRWRRGAAFLAGAVLGLAAGTRISAGVSLPVGLIFLWAERKTWPTLWVWFGLGAAAACGALFLPFLAAAPDGFWFGLVEYHTQRHAGPLAQSLAFKAGFVSRLAQGYFLAAGMWVCVILARLLGLGSADSSPEGSASSAVGRTSRALWATAAGVTAIHITAPFPYDDYQVMVFPVFAAALAAAVVRLVPNARMMRWTLWSAALLAAAGSFSSPINQDWFMQGRDRIWWRMKDQTPLQKLQRTAREIRALAAPGDRLLTQDAYLAVETGLRLPRGLELGPFSYYPDWSTEKATRRHVLNRPMLEALLRSTDAPVAALSGYSLTIRCPEVQEIGAAEQDKWRAVVEERYTPKDVVRDFGQGYTTLRILVRAPGRPAERPQEAPASPAR